MINYLNKKNTYDFIHQFQFINNNIKPRLNKVTIDANNNDAINKNNLIYCTYYSLLLLFNQKVYIKKTKKSIASFGIRPNMHLGGILTLRKTSKVLHLLFYYINPSLGNYNNNITYIYKNNKYNIEINYGIEDLRSKLFLYSNKFTGLENKIGGCNITYSLESPIKYLPYYYLK